jgi:hypothetical protein
LIPVDIEQAAFCGPETNQTQEEAQLNFYVCSMRTAQELLVLAGTHAGARTS